MITIETVSEPDVRLIAHSGGDESVLAAMLVSTQSEDSIHQLTKDPNEGSGRINFLMKNRHGTPFEHNQFRFFVRAGIFVFREFHRHRIGWSYNEESGRYSQLKPEFYIPDEDRPLKQVGKPGAYEMVPAPELYSEMCDELCASYYTEYDRYERLLDMGVAKEVARMCLPVGITSAMYATCNARSLMAFLSLRTHEPEATFPSHPQYEIEQVARQFEIIFEEHMPITYKCWNENGRIAP
jgi:thymidylate synthase (FAD)